MKKKEILQMKPFFGVEEASAINDYMKTDGFLTEFKLTEKFSGMIASFTGAKYCVVVNNGTISLTLAAMATGVTDGDEVIVPNYTMVATPNSVKMFGATPIFVDVDPQTLCLDIKKVETAITARTKAIIMVSANGRYPDVGIDAFKELCKRKQIILIEDAAQSLGSFYPDGTHIGRAGLVGSFSFSAPKIISTGQGGALITDNEEIFIKLKSLKDFGRAQGGNDIHHTVGFNSKFTELQAVIGIEQMKKLEKRIKRKKEIWLRYKKNLKIVPNMKLFDHNLNHTAPWFIDSLVENREELISFLKDRGIGTRKMYPPLNQQLAYNVPGHFPISKLVGEKGLWLPSYVQLSNTEIDFISEKIIEFYG